MPGVDGHDACAGTRVTRTADGRGTGLRAGWSAMATWRDVRRMAGRLENVEESTCFGEPCFRVKRKLFAWMSTHEKDALAVRVDPDEQELIVAARPRLFFVTPHYRGYGAVLVRMKEATARDLAGPIEESYRLTLAS